MSKEEISEPPLIARDVSQVYLLERVAQMFGGDEALFEKTRGEVEQAATHPDKEFEPVLFYGDDASALIKSLKRATETADDHTAVGAKLMLEEHADPDMYDINSIPTRVTDENLVVEGALPYWKKIRPLRAQRADKANFSTGEQEAIEADEKKLDELVAASRVQGAGGARQETDEDNKLGRAAVIMASQNSSRLVRNYPIVEADPYQDPPTLSAEHDETGSQAERGFSDIDALQALMESESHARSSRHRR